MAKYKLKGLQMQQVPGHPGVDIPAFLASLGTSIGASCLITFINNPRKKSDRDMPAPGIKWIDGLVEISNSACVNPYVNSVNRTGIVKIQLDTK